jgi:hypothetical protein
MRRMVFFNPGQSVALAANAMQRHGIVICVLECRLRRQGGTRYSAPQRSDGGALIPCFHAAVTTLRRQAGIPGTASALRPAPPGDKRYHCEGRHSF